MRRVANAKATTEAQPHEHFDVIAGAGTGGISACMLGRLRMPVDKAIAEYAKLVKEVFKEKKMSGPTMYKGTKLQEALNAMIRDATGDEGERMIESRESLGCRTVVFAMAKHNLNANLPVLFRSYTVTTNPGPDCTIREALYATMAHPDLFKPIDIVDSSVSQSFVGGELGCSNPLAHVLSEVKRIYPDRQVACIISIGAGHARTIQIPTASRWHRTQDVIIMKDMARDSERVAEEMMGRFEGTGAVYVRFNVDQGLQNMKDDSWEKMGEAMQHTSAYLRKREISLKLEEAVRASMERRGVVTTAHAAGQVSRIPDAAKQLPIITRCPAPTAFYTGREDENTQLITCITGGKNELRVCVIYGLGGVGKTQLILNVIERTWDEWDHIIFVDASSAEAIEKALTAFGKANKTGDAYTDVIHWLETCGKRWLVAFDNADTASTNIRQYIPARGPSSSVLITTRLPDLARLARGPDSVCHLSSMNHSDGTVLLMKLVYSGNQPVMDDDETATDQLVKASSDADFGGLALAIVHAGAYIAHSQGMTIAKYRLLFVSQRRRMLDEYNKLPTTAKFDERGDTVYTTWRMCYDQLQPESRELLWLIAYMHYDGIFEDMFKRAAQNMHSKYYPLPLTDLQLQAQRRVIKSLSRLLAPDGHWDTVLFTRVIADLAAYSLIEFDRLNLTYRVHVLVHDWAKTLILHAPELAIECSATVLSLSIERENDAESLAFKRQLELHVTTFVDIQMASYMQRASQTPFSRVAHDTAGPLGAGVTETANTIGQVAADTNNAGYGDDVVETYQASQPGDLCDVMERANRLVEHANLLMERSNQLAERSNQLMELSNTPSDQPNRPVERLGEVLGCINKVLVGIQHAIVRNYKGNTTDAIDCLVNEKGETPAISETVCKWTFRAFSSMYTNEKLRIPVSIGGTTHNAYIPNQWLGEFLSFYGIGEDLRKGNGDFLLKDGTEEIARRRLSNYFSSCLG
ncbi:calcium-independent phospholipase A2-gamma, putative, partial [Rhizoctonia solani AG-3 Rhs1AP]